MRDKRANYGVCKLISF